MDIRASNVDCTSWIGGFDLGDKIYVIGRGLKPGLSVSNLNEVFHIIKS